MSYLMDDPKLWHYRAIVKRVIDGDTLDVMIDQGFRNYREERLRVLGIDTPELSRGNDESKALGLRAKNRVEELCGDAEVIIRTEKGDSFGRWLATITLHDGRDLGTLLIREGLARPYKK